MSTLVDSKQMKIETQYLSDIIITAVEGGIGYWAQVKNYHWQTGPASCMIREIDNEDKFIGEWKKVTTDLIKAALQKIISLEVKTNDYIVKTCAGAFALKDAIDFDCELADVVVQVAILNEIKYA
jgi:hypothetical protein